MGGGASADGTRRSTRRRTRGLRRCAALAAVAVMVVGGSAATAHAGGLGWTAMGTGLYDSINDAVGTAYATLTVGNVTYVGGEFDDAGGVAVNNIAVWDGSLFQAVGNPNTDGPPSPVWSLATDGGLVYASGAFGVMSWDPSNQIWADLDAPAAMEAYAVAWYADGTDAFVVAGGDMSPGSTCALEKYDGGVWTAIGDLTRVGNPCTVDSLAQFQDKLVIGGEFDHDGATPLASMAFYDGTTDTLSAVQGASGDGVHDYTDGGDETGAVWALAVDAATNTIYLGGSFDDAGGTATTNLAAWNNGAFTEIGGAATQFDVTNDEVDTLAYANNGLAVGGWFSLDGTPVNVGFIDVAADTWIPLLGGTDDAVLTIGLNEALAQIYVGGMFTTVYSDTTPTPVPNTGGIARFGYVGDPPQISAISVTGTATVGHTLTAHVTTTGDPTPTVTLEWIRCDAWVGLTAVPAGDVQVQRLMPPGCVAIDGATASTYRLVGADAGKYIGVIALVGNNLGSAADMSVQRTPVAAAAAPTTTTPTPTTTPATTAPDFELPATGNSSGSLSWTALGLLVVGLALWVPVRRRWLR